MQYDLYQILIETPSAIFQFAVGTSNLDAVDIAKKELNDLEHVRFSDMHVGGYCFIGTTDRYGINQFIQH
jgi:hypothetical protein